MKPTGLLEALKNSAFFSVAQFEQLETLCRQRQIALIPAIADQAEINTLKLAQHCAVLFQLTLRTIDPPFSIELIHNLELAGLVKRWFAIPVALQNNWLLLAVTDPLDNECVQAFQFATGLHIQRQICDIAQAMAVINALTPNGVGEPEVSPYQLSSEFSVTSDDDDREHQEDDPYATPIGQYVHQIILYALKQGASDIHFEPFERSYRIRMRIDGLLITTHLPDKTLNRRLSSRLKLLAQLNIAEKRLPQDGRIQLALEQHRHVDIRVSTLATFWGEKVVLRLLGSGSNNTTLPQIGLTPSQLTLLHQQLASPQGLILVTGPTGSGKTTTLYAALHYLNQECRNISTIEDPIEIQLPGVNQIQANEAIGLDFSTVLRALLRQDPDIIMVGEIRDLATAQMAVRAAQTGHLVLSTLHTNSAHETVIRLNQMGVADYQLGASLKLIIAQRLLRKLCPHCKSQPIEHTSNIDLSRQFVANPKGCRHCLAGYRGRIGLYDFYQPQHLQATTEDDPLAKKRTCQLWLQGLTLIEQGITSLEELIRVVDPTPYQQNRRASR
jgi:type IV pilus assembly protein PilB